MTVSPGSLYEALAVQPERSSMRDLSWFVVGDDIVKRQLVYVHSTNCYYRKA